MLFLLLLFSSSYSAKDINLSHTLSQFFSSCESIFKVLNFFSTVSFVSAFALLPSPIIFGSIYDGACTIWAEKCGEKLNCLAYNTDKLRIGVGTLATIFVALGLCCDTAVWYFVKGLNIYDDDYDNTEENEENDNNTTITTDYGTRQNSMELNHHGQFEKT